MTLAAAFLSFALSASAKGDDMKPLEVPKLSAAGDVAAMEKAGEVMDPEMLKEMAGADSANLTNAMAKGKEEAERAAGHLAAAMASARFLGEALKADLTPVADEDAAEDLALHAAALKEKDAAFRRALASADLKAPTNEAEKLMAQRRTYPAADRRRDLRLAEDYLKAADSKRKGVKPAAGPRAAAEAARSFAAEAAALERLAGSLDAKLSQRRGSEPKLAEALDKAKPRRLALGADVTALKNEAHIFECSVALAAHDDADFDAAPKKGEQEEP